jgi:hypothetical protein
MISAALAVLRLTSRDRLVIRLLSELRYLTAAQLRTLCFPCASVSTASHRLTLLGRRGVLACLAHRAFADRRAFWCLSGLGRAVAASLGQASVETARAAAVAAVRIDHLIATNQVLCDLAVLQRAGRLGGLRWHGSQHAAIDVGEAQVVPDAAIVAAAPDGAGWMYCLELDRGTMSAAALAAKFDRYRLLARLAERRRQDPVWEVRASGWVLFACPDAARAALAARLAADRGLERFWSGTAAELPAGLADAIGPGSTAAAETAAGLRGGVVLPGAEDGQ